MAGSANRYQLGKIVIPLKILLWIYQIPVISHVLKVTNTDTWSKQEWIIQADVHFLSVILNRMWPFHLADLPNLGWSQLGGGKTTWHLCCSQRLPMFDRPNIHDPIFFLSAIVCPWLNLGLHLRCLQVVCCPWGEIEPFSVTLEGLWCSKDYAV